MSCSDQDRIDCPFCEKKISVYEECSQALGIPQPPPKRPDQSAFEAQPSLYRSKQIMSRYMRALERVCRYAWRLMSEASPKDGIRFLHETHRVTRICTSDCDDQSTCQTYQYGRACLSPSGPLLCKPRRLTQSEAVRELRPIVESTFRLLPEEDHSDVIESCLRGLGYLVEGNLTKVDNRRNEIRE